jgi:hypothetical protein
LLLVLGAGGTVKYWQECRKKQSKYTDMKGCCTDIKIPGGKSSSVAAASSSKFSPEGPLGLSSPFFSSLLLSFTEEDDAIDPSAEVKDIT